MKTHRRHLERCRGFSSVSRGSGLRTQPLISPVASLSSAGRLSLLMFFFCERLVWCTHSSGLQPEDVKRKLFLHSFLTAAAGGPVCRLTTGAAGILGCSSSQLEFASSLWFLPAHLTCQPMPGWLDFFFIFFFSWSFSSLFRRFLLLIHRGFLFFSFFFGHPWWHLEVPRARDQIRAGAVTYPTAATMLDP